eukprot:Lithocolla_globosa_v1_NODE_478_length_3945_cov_67.207712.p2 type:complete len:176 gc:universal NODE_478_length_3945_cov_67.207712:880-353(-)
MLLRVLKRSGKVLLGSCVAVSLGVTYLTLTEPPRKPNTLEPLQGNLTFNSLRLIEQFCDRSGLRLVKFYEASLCRQLRDATQERSTLPWMDAAAIERAELSLATFVRALNETQRMSLIGRGMAKMKLKATASSRKQLLDYIDQHPEVTKISVEKPIFIVGLPRTGSTFLHAHARC